MTKLDNPPLIEAIFQLCWGEVAPGQFSYTHEEQSLFAGKISAAAAMQGYKTAQDAQPNAPVLMPWVATHRFRDKDDTWPCFQVGLGIFTVNQVKNGYSWESFKNSIKIGLNVLEQADSEKLAKISNSLSVFLIYQDAFFPEENISTEAYLKDHFNINADLPSDFLSNPNIDRNKSNVDINIKIEIKEPKGFISIKIANAIINDQPGLLMETIVHSKMADITDKNGILNWVERAHEIQKHSFETLIQPTAYR
ncbi:MAG: TIGR04255 family protein [Methylococcales bacterium]|nr:TIGR04255 family protein [Methylococcales bacterium]